MARPIFFNSKECEWSDLRVVIEGSDATVKLTSLKYGVKTDKEHLFAGGDEPISIQSGNRAPQGSITLLKGAYDALTDAARASGGRDVTDLQLQIVAYYKPVGTRAPRTDILEGCEISDFEQGMAQNDKKMEVTLPFLFLKLKNV